MRVLIVTADYPASTRHAGSPRLFNLARELARSHEITLCLTNVSAERRSAHLSDGESLGIFSSAVELSSSTVAEPSPWRRLRHSLTLEPAFSSRITRPLHVAQLARALDMALSRSAAELLYINGLDQCQFRPADVRVPTVVDFCDSISWLTAQQAADAPDWRSRLALQLSLPGVRREERRALHLADAGVAISDVDALKLRELDANANLHVVPNGVDMEYFKHSLPSSASRSLIFTGVMGYPPNAEAATVCATEILPRVKAMFENATLALVGADPPTAVNALSSTSGVLVTGFVPDLRSYLREAAVFVSPLRVGAGVKNKLLVAMAMGVPIVANSLSISGISATPDVHFLHAETADEFAGQVARLFRDSELADRLSRSGRQLVEERYSWQAQGKLLEEALMNARDKKEHNCGRD